MKTIMIWKTIYCDDDEAAEVLEGKYNQELFQHEEVKLAKIEGKTARIDTGYESIIFSITG